jgi:chorismate mutase
MSDKLHINSVRNVLIRLEETIIFALIERGQFMQNRVIYDPGRFGSVLEGESLVGFMLLETERSHAKVRRYSGPEEHPFFDNLPQPILPPLHISDNPIRENSININRTIRRIYENDIVNHICAEGDDNEYGSSAVCDVSCLQSISKRIHYGKFVAESKFRKAGDTLLNAIKNCDKEAIMSSITDDSVEAAVLKRVSAKAHTYTQELAGTSAAFTVDPETVVDIYRKWIIPLNKQVQVEYLLQSCSNHQ